MQCSKNFQLRIQIETEQTHEMHDSFLYLFLYSLFTMVFFVMIKYHCFSCKTKSFLGSVENCTKLDKYRSNLDFIDRNRIQVTVDRRPTKLTALLKCKRVSTKSVTK